MVDHRLPDYWRSAFVGHLAHDAWQALVADRRRGGLHPRAGEAWLPLALTYFFDVPGTGKVRWMFCTIPFQFGPILSAIPAATPAVKADAAEVPTTYH